MKRKYVGRVAGAAAASLALGMMAQSAMAAAPACGPGNAAQTFAAPSGSLDIPDNDAAGITSTITVAGKAGVVRDVDLTTFIQHPVNREVSAWITHNGKTVLLVNGLPNKRAGSNGYNGTLWDDSAAKTISESEADLTPLNPPLTAVAPEGALGAFVGDDPNGAWTLKVSDNGALDTGTLTGWSLDLATAASTTGTLANVTGGQTGGAPDNAVPDTTQTITKTLSVAGLQPYLTDLNLRTDIEHHDAPGELKVWLTSPKGTKVLISNGRGDGSLTALTTLWNDSAPELISQAAWSNATPETRNRDQLVPEGALAAFNGENPNGTWTLTIEDSNVLTVNNPATPAVNESLQYGFDLNSWGLEVSSAAGCDPAVTPPVTPPTPPVTPPTPPVVPPTPPVVPLTPPTIATPPAPSCVRVGLVARIAGSKKVKRGRKGVVIVKLTNASKVAAATRSKATFVIPRGFSLVKKPKGATVRKHRVTLKLGTIRAGKSKSVRLILKAGSKAKVGRQKRTVVASAACGSRAVGKLAVTIKRR